MKTLYIDCGMGAAGDMLSGALLELLPDANATIKELNALGIPGVIFKRKSSVKCGITGTEFVVKVYDEEEKAESAGSDEALSADHDHHAHDHHEHDHHHEHEHHHGRTLKRIETIINSLKTDPDVKNEAIAIYKLIAQAESKVHGEAVDLIHFHEVGALDAIADITAFCYMLKELKPDRIVASPIHVGSGQVKCAHGILPVPAPATANILKGVPTYGGEIKGELCTPTGAAILKHFVDEFAEMPVMLTQSIGYGMGKKDFDRANCVRMVFGDAYEGNQSKRGKMDPVAALNDEVVIDDGSVVELVCTIDDMTGEEVGFATGNLLSMGALDVYTIAINMKKNRPGVELHVLCNNADRKTLIKGIFKFTSTLGIRENICKRYTLERRTEVVETPMGEVRMKVSDGFGVSRYKFEYEDLAWIAGDKKISLSEAEKLVQKSLKDKDKKKKK